MWTFFSLFFYEHHIKFLAHLRTRDDSGSSQWRHNLALWQRVRKLAKVMNQTLLNESHVIYSLTACEGLSVLETWEDKAMMVASRQESSS